MFEHFLENFRKPEDNFAGRFMLKSMNRGHEKLARWGRSYIKIKKEDTVLSDIFYVFMAERGGFEPPHGRPV